MEPNQAMRRVVSTPDPVKIARWRPELAVASAFLQPRHILLHANCSTSIGQFMCEPYVLLPLTTSDDDLGTAVLSVLNAARQAEPPAEPAEHLAAERKKLFRIAGVRSWKQLYTSSPHCSIEPSSAQLTLRPTRLDRRGALIPIGPDIVVAQPVAPAELGRALHEAFTLSTT
jgi:CDI immunity protein